MNKKKKNPYPREELMDYEYVEFQIIYIAQLGQLLSLVMVSSGHQGKERVIKFYWLYFVKFWFWNFQQIDLTLCLIAFVLHFA